MDHILQMHFSGANVTIRHELVRYRTGLHCDLSHFFVDILANVTIRHELVRYRTGVHCDLSHFFVANGHGPRIF